MTAKVRRIVTGVNQNGRSCVIEDCLARKVVSRPALSVESALVWITDETPVDLAKYSDPTDREIGVAPPSSGSILRVVDFLPNPERRIDNQAFLAEMGLSDARGTHVDGRHPFMHRTRSLDYALVLLGEIDMLLDEGEVHVAAGDILIQRGTNHAWVNRSSAICRIAFVLIDAAEYPPSTDARFPAPSSR